MSRTKGEHPNPSNILLFLRTHAGKTQAQMAKEMGLNLIDISRFERGSPKMTIGKVVVIAHHLGISVDDLVRDNYAAVLPRLSVVPIRDPSVQKRRRNCQLRKIDIGDAGEAFIATRERLKLEGTVYQRGVNEAYADNPCFGFDIFSFTRPGEPLFIEVKATVGALDEPFFLSSCEKDFLHHCLQNNIRYELHRVYNMSDPDNAEVRIYTAQELIEEFDFEVSCYEVHRRKTA